MSVGYVQSVRIMLNCLAILTFSIYFIICGLFIGAFSVTHTKYSVEWKDDTWMMNRKGCGRKQSWPNISYYPGICLEGLMKSTEQFSQDGRSPGRHLNPAPPEYKVEVLTTRSRRSIICSRECPRSEVTWKQLLLSTKQFSVAASEEICTVVSTGF
jgi:hypothetical protein